MSLFCVVYFCRDVFLFTRKLWLLSEHHVVVNERQICLQKGGESVCDLSWGMQQGQGTDPSCRSGSVSHRGSDRVCASGLAQVQGKAPATDEAQNISIPLVYKLLPSFCWRTGCYLHILSNFPQGSVWFWDEAKNKQKNLCHKAGSTVLPVGLVLYVLSALVAEVHLRSQPPGSGLWWRPWGADTSYGTSKCML